LHTFDAALQAPALQKAPAQHGCPLPPHATQLAPALSQTSGAPQYLPPLAPTQHGCPAPPHATHARPAHSVYAPVQPTPPPQQACPSLPQVPPLQPPVLQAPCPPEHRPPLATHWFAFASQQPPPEHHPLSQHG